MKRILALVLSLAVLCTTLIVAMPQTSAASDGMVRVWLKSMDYYGSISSTSITLNGSYSIPAAPDVVLSTRGQYTIEVVGGTLMISGTGINGAVDVGSKFTIKQHANDDGSIGTISLYNNKYGTRSYRGDMTFDINNGSLRLINRVYIEDYLYGVLAGELSNTFPLETLKAQAVIARSYVYNRMLGNEPNYEINDTSGDQVYKGYNSANTNIIKAVDDTAGVLLKYGSSYVNAYFGASNGGQIELPGNAWSSSSSLGCYVMKDDPYDVRNTSSRSVTYTFTSNPASLDTSFYTLIQEKVYQKVGYYPNISAIQSVSLSNPVQTDRRSVGISRNYQTMNMTVLVEDSWTGGYWDGSGSSNVYGDSNVYDGSYGTNVYSTGTTTQAVDITIDLHGELKYTLFSVDSDLRLFSLESTGDYYYLTLARYGHGVGMSQRGAQQMANEGKSYKDIIHFYFDDVSTPTMSFKRETLTKYVPISTTPIASGTINASSLTVRADASSTGTKLGSLQRGAVVDVYADLGEWLCIVYNGSIGYVSASYVTVSNYDGSATVQPSQTPDAGADGETSIGQARVTLSTASSTLKLRKTASSSGTVLISMPSGTVVDVLEYGSEWTKVRTSAGTVGYAATRYLTDITTDDNTTPSATAAPTQDNGGTVSGSAYIANDGVALRGTAGGNVIFEYLSKNTSVTVLEASGNYYYIRTVSGSYGYVEKSAVVTAATATTTAAPTPSQKTDTVAATGTVTGSSVNVRSGPSTTATKLGQVTKGQSVNILSQNNDFYKIQYGSSTGYVSASYVRVNSSVPSATQTPITTPAATPTPSVQTMYVAKDETKLFDSAGGNVASAMLSKGTAVTVLSVSGDYTYVSTSVGTGYVLTESLVSVNPSAPTPTPTINVSAGTSYISTNNAPLLGSPGGNVINEYLAYGTIVTIHSTSGSYSYVTTRSGAVGYVLSSEITTAKEDTQPTQTPGSTATTTGGTIKLSSSSSSLNLRQGPSTSTGVVTQIKHGAAVTITGTSGDWYAVDCGGYSGYVMKKYVVIGASGVDSDDGSDSSSATTYPGTVKLSSAASTVNVRSGAGTNYSKLGTLAHGASVSIVARNGDWYKIEYGTGYGYVLKSYVRLTSSSSDSSSGNSANTSYGTATTTASINLRSAGNTSSTKLGTYAKGTKVTVLSKGSVWSKVKVDGKTGYMKNDYLKFS